MSKAYVRKELKAAKGMVYMRYLLCTEERHAGQTSTHLQFAQEASVQLLTWQNVIKQYCKRFLGGFI